MPLFQKSVINRYLKILDSGKVDEAFNKFQKFYGNKLRLHNIMQLKEENYQEGFLREIFADTLGYTINPNENFNLTTEFKNATDSRKADGAIIKNGKAIGVIELKSTKTKNLESIKEQAFGYKNNQPDCKYVITSNFQKLRFYIDNATDYEEFNLFHLDKKQFKLLYLLLSKDSIFSNLPEKLKQETKFHEDNISARLYADYKQFKDKIFDNLVKNNPQYDKLTLFKKSQKLLDRFLFIFFAEDCGLIPPNAVSKIIEQWKTLQELDEYKPLYSRFQKLFMHLDKGHTYKKWGEIPAYNGGLFRNDEVLDNTVLKIDDEVLENDSLKLSKYDFNTEVDVNILGHIFEHSLNEIEEITAELSSLLLPPMGLNPLDKQISKRKKDGIFYTPKYITKYIVENTIGKLCDEKKSELQIANLSIDDTYRKKDKKINAKGKKLFNTLNTYKDWLFSLKILDPACGSGAFLNQALDFLIAEHKQIDDIIAELTGSDLRLFDTDKTILENNIFGVDINEESVEIARLSLWLRTARKGRKLSDLSANIKCGNSLIDDPKIAGDKAFDWYKEFPQVFPSFGGVNCEAGRGGQFPSFGGVPKGRGGISRISQNYFKLPYNPALKERAKALRKAGVLSEVLFWNQVKQKQFKGYDFDRQKIIGNYIVDFFCTNCNVVIEIDGNSHNEKQEYDQKRDEYLQSLGLTVIHIPDIDIKKRLAETMNWLYNHEALNSTSLEGIPPRPLGTPPKEGNIPPRPADTPPKEGSIPPRPADTPPKEGNFSHTAGGFDVVIGNPPYVKEYTSKQAFNGLRQKQCYQGKMDLWYFFGDLALDIVKKETGLIGFIAPNNWITNAGASNFRNIILEKGKILEFVDFGDFKVFESAGIQTMIYIMSATKNNENYQLNYSKILNKKIKQNDVINFLNKSLSPDFEYFNTEINKHKYKDKLIHFINSNIDIVLKKIKKQQNFILEKNEVAQGIVAPQDFLNASNANILGSNFKQGQGIFNLSEEEKNSCNFSDEELKLIKPFYTTEELGKYYGNPINKLWVIYTNSSYKQADSLDDFPNLKSHLDKFQSVITSDNKPYGLHRAREEKFFIGEKIISLRKCAEPTFTYTNFDCYVSQTYFSIKTERVNMQFLTILLNSKLIKFWLRYKGKMQGDLFQVDKAPLMALPIRIAEAQQPFIAQADKMLKLHKNLQKKSEKFIKRIKSNLEVEKITKNLQNFYNFDFKVFIKELKKQKVKLSLHEQDEWEDYFEQYKMEINQIQKQINKTDREIDEMVYELYELTPQEIEVVESS